MVYTLLLPGLIWLLLFAYLPMGGLSLAFKDYKANLGIWGSPWVGFENFKYVFRDPAFIDALWRTLYINIIKLVIQFPFPILLALMLNELRMRRTKKSSRRSLRSLISCPGLSYPASSSMCWRMTGS